MRFLIRDDDTCGVTRVNDLERCYASVWKYAPVCFSVTPFRMPAKADWVPKEFFGSLDPVALEENNELIAGVPEDRSAKENDEQHGHGPRSAPWSLRDSM